MREYTGRLEQEVQEWKSFMLERKRGWILEEAALKAVDRGEVKVGERITYLCKGKNVPPFYIFSV